MSNRQYLKAEVLKHHHTAINKILIFMPVICVVMSAFLTHVFFAVDGYNLSLIHISEPTRRS